MIKDRERRLAQKALEMARGRLGLECVETGKDAPQAAAALAAEIMEGRAGDEVIVDGDYRLERWVLRSTAHPCAVYLHSTVGDDPAVLHDHPADNVSWVLEGGGRERREDRTVTLAPGTVVARQAESGHALEIPPPGMVTIWVRGPTRHRWGFHCPEGHVEAARYPGGGRRRRLHRPGAVGGSAQVVLRRMVPEEAVVEVDAGTPVEMGRRAMEKAAGAQWRRSVLDPDAPRVAGITLAGQAREPDYTHQPFERTDASVLATAIRRQAQAQGAGALVEQLLALEASLRGPR